MQQSSNQLKVSEDYKARQQKQIASLLHPTEKIIHFTYIWKYNRDGRCQERILILTNLALLNILKNQNILKNFMKKFVQFEDSYQIKRRILIQNLYGVTITPNRNSNVFLIHVINDHDYYYKAVTNKLPLLQLISQNYRRITKKQLAFYFREELVILNYCTFKNHLKQKKDLKPKEKPHFLNNEYFRQKQFEDIQYICEYSQNEKNKSIRPKHFRRIDLNKIKTGNNYYILKEEVNRSIRLNSFVNHPNILKPSYCFFNQKKQLMFIPFMIGGCFKNYIDKYLPLKKEHIIFYIAQIITILQKLLSQGKLYPNLNLQNIYVKSNGYIALDGLKKITQVPKTKQKEHYIYKISGNPFYFSPQMLACQGVQNDVDIWKIGICSYYMWKGHYPFRGKNIKQLYYNILTSSILEPDLPDFIGKLLQKDKDQRLTLNQLKNHQNFSRISWKNLEQERISAPFPVNINNWSGKLPIIYELQTGLQQISK